MDMQIIDSKAIYKRNKQAMYLPPYEVHLVHLVAGIRTDVSYRTAGDVSRIDASDKLRCVREIYHIIAVGKAH